MKTNKKEKTIIGIDVSKDTLDVYTRAQWYKIKNDSVTIEKFIEKLPQCENRDSLCVMESTGGYERTAFKAFIKANIPVHIAHPNKVFAFAKAVGHFAKTDKLDALLLHKYGELIAEQEEGDEILSETQQAIMALRKLYRSVEQTLHAVKCKIKQMPEPCCKYLKKEIDLHTEQLKAIQKEIDEKIETDSELKSKRDIMMSMKGVGKKTASSLLAEMPELGKISSRKITSLIGVAPKTHQSGKSNFKGKICGGRFYARKALYMVSLVVAHTDKIVATKYQSMIARGKPKKVALVAIMREIIIALNAMIRDMQPFNYRNYGASAT